MDLRVEKTKSCIINAFIELRSQKQLEKISVKELCERARIHKSTFYSHYVDIYELADAIETEVVDSIIQSLSHPEYVFEKPAEFTKDLFLAYLAQDSLIQILFSGNRRGNLIAQIEKCLKELIFQERPEYQGDPVKNMILSYQIYGGYYTFEENRNCSIDQVIEIIARIAEGISRMYGTKAKE